MTINKPSIKQGGDFRRLRRQALAWTVGLVGLLVGTVAMWGLVERPFVAVTTTYPPFAFEDNGEAKGLAVDLVKEAFARMHTEVRILVLPFARALEMIKSGEADGIFPFSINEDRKAFADYANDWLVESAQTLFVLSDSPIRFDGDLAKLGAYNFGVERGANYGTTFNNALKNKIIIHVDEAATQVLNIQKLVNNRIHIVVGPREVIWYSAKQIGKTAAIKELRPPLDKPLAAYLGFSKKNNLAKTIEAFNISLAGIRQDGTYQRIVAHYE